jgi:hypothetical protein
LGKFFSAPQFPPGFDGVNLPLPRTTREAFRSLNLNFFRASLFQRGKKEKEFSLACRRALLPLKKGGREGFLATPFHRAKVIQVQKLIQGQALTWQGPAGENSMPVIPK